MTYAGSACRAARRRLRSPREPSPLPGATTTISDGASARGAPRWKSTPPRRRRSRSVAFRGRDAAVEDGWFRELGQRRRDYREPVGDRIPSEIAEEDDPVVLCGSAFNAVRAKSTAAARSVARSDGVTSARARAAARRSEVGASAMRAGRPASTTVIGVSFPDRLEQLFRAFFCEIPPRLFVGRRGAHAERIVHDERERHRGHPTHARETSDHNARGEWRRGRRARRSSPSEERGAANPRDGFAAGPYSRASGRAPRRETPVPSHGLAAAGARRPVRRRRRRSRARPRRRSSSVPAPSTDARIA